MEDLTSARFATLCSHAGEDRNAHHGAVITPIYQTSIFVADSKEEYEQSPYHYTRGSNPTVEVAERKLAALEGAQEARCFASGMAAISSAILSSVKAGDHVVCVDQVYGCVPALANTVLKRFNVSVDYVDGRDPENFRAAIRPNTALFYMESPTSFYQQLQDIAAVCRIAKAHGITTVIDNSCATPYFQSPIALGVDIVVHSASKYLGGHSDIVLGIAAGSRERIEAMTREEYALLGGIAAPMSAFLMTRGMRTLPLRMKQHEISGAMVASYLEKHPRVKQVYYAGLDSFAQRELKQRQMRGSGSLFSIELDAGDEAIASFVRNLRFFSYGVSWGGFESLATASGQRVRLFVGLEDPQDLLEDLDQALRAL